MKFKTTAQLEKAIRLYFAGLEKNSRPPTITGLAYHLGFESRQSFYDYEKRETFSYTIRRARLFIESTYEEQLRDKYAQGAIFALKNFGWRDRQELEHSGVLDLAGLIDDARRRVNGSGSS